MITNYKHQKLVPYVAWETAWNADSGRAWKMGAGSAGTFVVLSAMINFTILGIIPMAVFCVWFATQFYVRHFSKHVFVEIQWGDANEKFERPAEKIIHAMANFRREIDCAEEKSNKVALKDHYNELMPTAYALVSKLRRLSKGLTSAPYLEKEILTEASDFLKVADASILVSVMPSKRDPHITDVYDLEERLVLQLNAYGEIGIAAADKLQLTTVGEAIMNEANGKYDPPKESPSEEFIRPPSAGNTSSRPRRPEVVHADSIITR